MVVRDVLWRQLVAACASAGQWRAGLKVFDDFHRAREGARPKEAEVVRGEMQSEELSMRQENAQLNEVKLAARRPQPPRRDARGSRLDGGGGAEGGEQYALGDDDVEMLKREDTQITEDLFVRPEAEVAHGRADQVPQGSSPHPRRRLRPRQSTAPQP